MFLYFRCITRGARYLNIFWNKCNSHLQCQLYNLLLLNWYLLGMEMNLGHGHKTWFCYLLGVFSQFSDKHSCQFYRGVPPPHRRFVSKQLISKRLCVALTCHLSCIRLWNPHDIKTSFNLLGNQRFCGCHKNHLPLRVPSVEIVHHNCCNKSFSQASWQSD